MHLGVRVTLIRADSTGNYPAERLFEDADNWVFTDDFLHIIKELSDATSTPDNPKRVDIAMFPQDGIESVEFASEETV